jgi:drug/metabolite transporter (DMT)-like permease
VAVKFVSAIEIMLIPVVEPILNPIWVMIFMGERPGPWAIVGGAVVLGAVTARGLLSGRGESGPPADAECGMRNVE